MLQPPRRVQTGEVVRGTRDGRERDRKRKERCDRRMKMHWTRKEGLGSHIEQKGGEGVTRRVWTAGHTDGQTQVLLYLLSSLEVERGESENVIITREKGQ